MLFVIIEHVEGNHECGYIGGDSDEQAQKIEKLLEEGSTILKEIQLSEKRIKQFKNAISFFKNLESFDSSSEDTPIALIEELILTTYLKSTGKSRRSKSQLYVVGKES